MIFSGEWEPQIKILVCEMTRGAPHHRNWNSDNMSAGYWRLYWAPFRHFRVILNKVEFSPDAGYLMLIPPHTPFNGRCHSGLHQFLIHFTVAAPFDNMRPEIFMVSVSPEMRSYIDESVVCLDKGDMIRVANLSIILCLRSLLQIPADRQRNHPTDPRIISAVRHLETHIALPPPVTEMARSAGLNVNSFIRLFRQQTGFTPQQYGLRKRIEKAGLLLEQTRLSIDEIAEQTGFCHRNHFTRGFTRIQGQSPAAYRRKNRQAYP